jgi:hypothetical protein
LAQDNVLAESFVRRPSRGNRFTGEPVAYASDGEDGFSIEHIEVFYITPGAGISTLEHF